MSEESLLNLYKHFLSNVLPYFRTISQISRHAEAEALQSHPNPVARCGAKVFSQNEEDGIIFEIVRRIGIGKGVFAEFGVGNGTENNTLALAAAEWSGFWAGGEELGFNYNPLNATKLNFYYNRQWITKSNIVSLYRNGLEKIGKDRCDLVSLDLDGNDYHLIGELLDNVEKPSVFVVEYNAKFIPPIRFVIDYDEAHQWRGDDYFGASLQSFVDLFQRHGYFLVCCNITGANAFFVHERHKHQFADIPTRIEDLFGLPKYFLTGLDFSGHPISARTLEAIFRKLNPAT